MKGKLSQCSTLYEVIKNQRNKYANLTQASAQELAEMKEKIKILQNEVEILRSESAAKDKSLADEARVLQTAQSTRDALRLEQSKTQMKAKEVKEECARQLMEIEKLNNIINEAEKEMIRLRKDYARAVEDRNRTGIQLIDRNDELCILHEKANIYDGLLKRGERQLSEYEERTRRIKIEISEIEWNIRVSCTYTQHHTHIHIRIHLYTHMGICTQINTKSLHACYYAHNLAHPCKLEPPIYADTYTHIE